MNPDGTASDTSDGIAFDGGDADYPPPVDAPETVGDLVARGRRTSGPALRAEAVDRTLSYRDFVTTSYRVGNVLRYLGVRSGETVLVVPAALPEPTLAFYGAAQLGAATRFAEAVDDGGAAAGDDDADGEPPRVVVAPSEREGDFDLPPGHRLLAYGDRPDHPSTTHWETEVWSENPAIHPASVDGADALVRAGDRAYSHAEALSAAADAVAAADIRPGDEVEVEGSLADPDVVAAGLLAPIAAGATIVFPDGRAGKR